MSAGYHSLFVYCDLIDPWFVGDSMTKLLRRVPIKPRAEHGDQVTETFEDPIFLTLLKRSFDTVEIDIKDDANETVSFKFGRSSVTLLFRKHE